MASHGCDKGSFLFVRTCKYDMTAWGGFLWKRRGRVVADDWVSSPSCGYGLHGFMWGWGNPNLADWHQSAKWLVCRAKYHVDLDSKIKVPECSVVYCGTRQGAARYLWDAGVRGVIIPASRAMSTFAWCWWASLGWDARERLLLTLPNDIGQMRMSDAAELKRTMLVADWMMRTSLPAWLDAIGNDTLAAEYRALPAIVDIESLNTATAALADMKERVRNAVVWTEYPATKASAHAAAWSWLTSGWEEGKYNPMYTLLLPAHIAVCRAIRVAKAAERERTVAIMQDAARELIVRMSKV